MYLVMYTSLAANCTYKYLYMTGITKTDHNVTTTEIHT